MLRIKRNRLMPDHVTGEEKRICLVSGIYGDELGGQYICGEIIRRIKAESVSYTHLAKLDAGVPYVIRQNNPTEGTTSFVDEIYGEITVDNIELDDMILIKSDGYPTYNFANVVDDHLMGITHVVRGNEYLSSTPKYNRLYDAFGWEKPVRCV